MLVLQLLEQGAKASARRADVDLGVVLAVRMLGCRATSVAEAIDVFAGVAEGGGVDAPLDELVVER